MKENKNYPRFVRKVFSYFDGCKKGQGLFLFRTLLANRMKYTASDYKLMLFTIFNLIDQDYLAYKEGDFIVLTQNGYDYMQGEEMPCNQVNFNHLIKPQDDSQTRFDQLWLLIGKEDSSLFYVSGPCFYNTIKPYLINLHGDYSEYMEALKTQGLSTSRIKWYRSLYCQLRDEESEQFLQDLSSSVKQLYSDTDAFHVAEGSHENEKNMAMSLENGTPSLETASKAPSVALKTKKKVFISYCWEDDEHQKWVHKLAEDLADKFEVKIDAKQPLGTELNQFMEKMVRDSDKVLIIATPSYKNRADGRIKGVGYETSLITNDLVSDQNRIKFIPIIRKGSKEESFPSYLGNRKGLDMMDDTKYKENLKELIENLKNY